MRTLSICFLFVVCLKFVNLQGTGSGANGNLRLCVVEGRGTYKRGIKYCPVLDAENSGVECVLGTDRLDCLRRISKGTVDFGVFSPEDLIAAQWANIDVLVTNELRDKHNPFERSIVAVVNRRILPETTSSLRGVLQNTTLCHPGVGIEDLRPLSDTLSGYLESLVITRSCEPDLSLSENRIRALAGFFRGACKAGPWVPDPARDAELKQRYPSLCAACDSSQCVHTDRYWGDTGALACLADGAGDVLWATKDDVTAYFGLNGREGVTSGAPFAYLCRDGSSQPLEHNPEPCVWLERPWPVVVAKRKTAVAVTGLISSLTSATLTDSHWKGALAALLELRKPASPVEPAKTPLDHLASARGFREAYSQSGCDPPRHITLCTTSLLAKNKCEWLSEAGAVYGVTPPLQCASEDGARACLAAVRDGRSDVAVVGDMLVPAMRDYELEPILYEATPIAEKMNSVVAYVRNDSAIIDIAELRGLRAAFPKYDGIAWHAFEHYLKTKDVNCEHTENFFSQICAPGIEKLNISKAIIDKYTSSCYKDGETVLDGERLALKSLVDGKSDVAFISMETYNIEANQNDLPWESFSKTFISVCPEENLKYCFIGWSNIGHFFVAKNITDMRRHEIINVFTKLDQLFGKQQPFHSAMFSMYGPFNHQPDIIFHNNTKSLVTLEMLKEYPYSTIPFNFERNFINKTFESCLMTNIKGEAVNTMSSSVLILLIASLVINLI